MAHKTIFYYQFEKLNAWLAVNILLCFAIGYFHLISGSFLESVELKVMFLLFVLSTAGWIWKYCFRHPIVVMDDQTLRIDYCRPLKWQDIQSMEEKVVRCGFFSYRILVLKASPIWYRYNFLQKHNGGFTPFSLPLDRNISSQKANEMKDFIAQKLKSLR